MLKIYTYLFNTKNFFKKISSKHHHHFHNSNNFLFKFYKNLPYQYTWYIVRSMINKKIFYKNLPKYTKLIGLKFFIKPQLLVYNARLAFKQLFFIKKPTYVLTKIINIFFYFSGFQIHNFFYKNLFFFYKNLFFFYKNLFFFYKNLFFIINNKVVLNLWYITKVNDLVKFLINPYILLFFFKKLYFFFNKKFLYKILYQLTKHFFLKNKTAKTQFKFFWKKSINFNSMLLANYIIDYKVGLAVTRQFTKVNVVDKWSNWFAFSIYNWKYII